MSGMHSSTVVLERSVVTEKKIGMERAFELLPQVQASDREAGSEFIQCISPLVQDTTRRHAAKLVWNDHDRDDLCQETLRSVYEILLRSDNQPSFENPEKLGAFIVKIATGRIKKAHEYRTAGKRFVPGTAEVDVNMIVGPAHVDPDLFSLKLRAAAAAIGDVVRTPRYVDIIKADLGLAGELTRKPSGAERQAKSRAWGQVKRNPDLMGTIHGIMAADTPLEVEEARGIGRSR